MLTSHFVITVVNKPPKSIRITLPANLFYAVTLLSGSGIKPSMVV